MISLILNIHVFSNDKNFFEFRNKLIKLAKKAKISESMQSINIDALVNNAGVQFQKKSLVNILFF